MAGFLYVEHLVNIFFFCDKLVFAIKAVFASLFVIQSSWELNNTLLPNV